jgi:holliday junction DNA helicase RuvA
MARAPGVGPKVAARIVAELKDKMPALAPSIRPGGGVAPTAIIPEGASARDAVSALTNLGYGHAQAAAAVSLAVGKAGREARTEELIRLGLRELAQ